MKVLSRLTRQFLAVFSSALISSASADSVTLVPVADTTLIQAAPDNNNGGHVAVNSGTTQNYTKTRGLFRFDPAAAIPKGSRILSAQLFVEVVGEPNEPGNASNFDLHRVLKPWGEGNKTYNPGAFGLGKTATINEATWNHRFALTTNTWDQPGGAAGTDYLTNISSWAAIFGVRDYSFPSSTQMVADVQFWFENPESNFGWILISESEDLNFTARRFGSREDANSTPLLEIEFAPPPKVEGIQASENQFHFSFLADAGSSYAIEQSGFLTGTWEILTNIPAAPTNSTVQITTPLSPTNRFFRIVKPE